MIAKRVSWICRLPRMANCLFPLLDWLCGVSRGTKISKRAKVTSVRSEIIQKLACQEKVVEMKVTMGRPMMEAIEKPAKIQDRSEALFSKGATKLAITKIREIIAPAIVADKRRGAGGA